MQYRSPIIITLLALCVIGAACDADPITDGPGGTGGSGGSGGTGGAGGAAPCNGTCAAPTPICDATTNTCVACLDDTHCTDVLAARCGAKTNTCQPCDASAQCSGLSGTEVCEGGTCVQCSASDGSACSATQSCNLFNYTCVDVAPTTVTTCKACSNDDQCEAGHRCVPMQFMDAPHGHYCLKEPTPTCDQPYTTFINQPSINGEPAQNYCGIAESQTTCEAVLALLTNWVCTGTDGKCSPMMGEPEVDVPGALCKQVGPLADRCTYACGSTAECLPTGPGITCGTGTNNPPGWCGG